MSRAQQGQVLDTAKAENSTYNQNAQDAFTKAGQDISTYGDAVGKFQAANPYVQGGQAETAENQVTADTAAGMGQSAGQAIQSAAVRTGANAGGAISATEKMQQENERALVGDQAKATESRLTAGTGYQEAGLEGLSKVQGMQDTLAQQQAAAAQGALGTEEQAANTPSFLDELGQGLITGGAQVGSAAITAFCPAKGSLYLMADGSERLVENLMVGDVLAGIDGDSEVIEEIQSATSPVLRIQTEDGFTTRNSRVHAFALPVGGFVVDINSLNKIVLTEKGRGKVVAVEWDGEDTVYNVITDGSHTYRADGVWALGVGEAERQVSMAKWGEIGDNLAEAVSHGRG